MEKIEKLISDYEQALEELDKIISLGFRNISPVNEQAEKKKFFSFPKYEPQFKYEKPELDAERIVSKIKNLKLPAHPLRYSLKRKTDRLMLQKKLLEKIGKIDFYKKSNKILGLPSISLVENAKKILLLKEENNSRMISSKQAIAASRDFLKKCGLKEWNVEEKEMASNAAVYASIKKIYVKKNAFFPEIFLKRILHHEIETHVFRSENGADQPHKIFKIGFADYLATEEGLAANIEEINGCLDINTLRTYAGRVIAVDYAKTNSFRKTFEMLKKYFNNEKAWEITLRVKRGTSDTSKKGCYSRDWIYLQGYYDVKAFLKKEGMNGLKKLFYGKISLKEVLILKKMNYLKEPKFFPSSTK